MGYKAEVIADSLNPAGERLTTMVLRFPWIILAEFLTHRMFSRNASSSRAIPVKKLIALVLADPYVPAEWGRNQRGMQAGAVLGPLKAFAARMVWLGAMHAAIASARVLAWLGVHKQWVNRLLAPFSYVTMIVSATEWANFFALRDHPAAQPEMQGLAKAMLAAFEASTPAPLGAGEWHIPFGDRMPEGAPLGERVAIATARCARVSYLTHDGEHAPERDVALHDDLARDGHWSPFEHCARAVGDLGVPVGFANYTGWQQYRHLYGSRSMAFWGSE